MEENFNVRVSAYVTKDEARKIAELAKLSGLSVSQYLRNILCDTVIAKYDVLFGGK